MNNMVSRQLTIRKFLWKGKYNYEESVTGCLALIVGSLFFEFINEYKKITRQNAGHLEHLYKLRGEKEVRFLNLKQA